MIFYPLRKSLLFIGSYEIFRKSTSIVLTIKLFFLNSLFEAYQYLVSNFHRRNNL